tara:strand:+ start:629 stop:799 length:171 start_codon:yes stop_codon:yes gene_type:complete
MQIGDLVKWLLRGDDYGEIGIVTDVFSNGNFTVFWSKGSSHANHGKETKHIEIVYK